MPKYTVKEVIKVDGEEFAAGSIVELTEEQAVELGEKVEIALPAEV